MCMRGKNPKGQRLFYQDIERTIQRNKNMNKRHKQLSEQQEGTYTLTSS